MAARAKSLVSGLVLVSELLAQGTGDSGRLNATVWPILQRNCLACHSSRNPTNGLALDSREAMLRGGRRGPALRPGEARQSLLMEAVAQTGTLRMPPGGRLKPEEIQALQVWIDAGAPWAEVKPRHWAFELPRRTEPPAVQNVAWPRTPIDRFILARLEKEHLRPSTEADKATLLRRVTLDLIGLPPTPQEIEEFLADGRPDAYERVVDRLLQSPHYGEKWGRHWLDVARYADSHGYNIDAPRQIWKYRDWVIEALNRNMPFDQFVIEQIAGDLLPNPTTDQLIATGYHRNTLLNFEGGIDFEQYRVEAVVDRVDNTGAVFLGLTLGCARCHDHKYDPISQREFYQLYAFFNNVDEMTNGRDREFFEQPVLELPTPQEAARRAAFQAQLKALLEELKGYRQAQGLAEKQQQWERTVTQEEKLELPLEMQHILDLKPEVRTLDQQLRVMALFARKKGLTEFSERLNAIQALRKREPTVTSTLIMKELPQPREAYVHVGGDFLRKGEVVEPGVPAVLPPLKVEGRATRLDLARWLVSPDHPLTARVTVNRIWQQYFGKGIVATENDFGTQGSQPSHPELLDWLAIEFVRLKWDLKALHRLIVTSAVYRQSSAARPDAAAVDPENRLLARQNRLRLDAELIRDAALASSGLLSRKIGGPSVYPPIPAGALKVTQVDRPWPVASGPDRYRRGMYTTFWRSAPHPMLITFDAPDSTAACTRRNRSNTPLQALTLLNNEAFFEASQALGARILKEATGDDQERIHYAYLLTCGRRPLPEERERIGKFLAAQRKQFHTDPDAAQAWVRESDRERADISELAVWIALARALLNTDEFITRE